jgi:redox-sensitive bicupin YhaK (pirin superfamily)
MEIISYVLAGALLHEDNLGHRHTLKAGEIQRMSAGTGIVHSEFNASDSEPVHFLQIWIFPDTKGLTPDYEIAPMPAAASGNGFTKLVVPANERSRADNTLLIHQDVTIYGAHLNIGDKLTHQLPGQRTAYLHLAKGAAHINGEKLQAGDGVTLKQETELFIEATATSEMLLFDLP